MKRREVSAEQKLELASRDEDTFFDRKSKRAKPAKLARTVAAFANTDGGELAIGIEDDGSWDGFERIEDVNDIVSVISQVALNSIEFEALHTEVDSGIVLLVTVHRSVGVSFPPGETGKTYVREAASSTPVVEERLEALRRSKGVVSYETQALTYPVDDLLNTFPVLDFCLNVVPSVEPRDFLAKQGLVVSGERPTVGGTLLFHDEPQVHIPASAIKVYRYRTDGHPDRKYLNSKPESIDGPLVDQIYRAVARVTEIIDSIPRVTRDGMESVKYPPEVLHEILTNAVIHRDYSINDNVHVRIFDNRVEVESPGRLPGGITPGNILNERFARNPAIVRLITRFSNAPNMDVGEGLNTAFRAMEELRLQPPLISEHDDRVWVVIRHEPLASPEQAILDYLHEHGSINNATARRITRIEQERTIRRVFNQLREAGELERSGTGRGTRYKLAGDVDASTAEVARGR